MTQLLDSNAPPAPITITAGDRASLLAVLHAAELPPKEMDDRLVRTLTALVNMIGALAFRLTGERMIVHVPREDGQLVDFDSSVGFISWAPARDEYAPPADGTTAVASPTAGETSPVPSDAPRPSDPGSGGVASHPASPRTGA